MWRWSEQHFRTGELEEEPALATFAAGLVADGPGRIDLDRSLMSRYPLHSLFLIEWDLSEDVPALFEILRAAGATTGFFIDYPGHEDEPGRFRACNLSPAAAELIRGEALFSSATMFVDDRFLSVVAAWYTDNTHLCMRQPLFDTYLSAHPMYLDLEGDPAERPSCCYEAARAAAEKRFDNWLHPAPRGTGISRVPRPRR